MCTYVIVGILDFDPALGIFYLETWYMRPGINYTLAIVSQKDTRSVATNHTAYLHLARAPEIEVV